ncbi:MAG: multidrug effflux MFS transporter [Pseudomonadota bacterium]
MPFLPRPSRHPGNAEFLAMMALTMSLVALAIDAMLPAHGVIGAEFDVARANDTQYIVYTLFVGLGFGQILFGPLSDAVGRKPALFVGLTIFVVGVIVSLVADSYSGLLVGRFLQGIGVASPRVMTVTIVRDRFVGREMARIMSFVITLFILVPAFAPAIGQVLIDWSGWRSIFWSLLVAAVGIALWFVVRQPETLSPDHCQTLSPRRIGRNIVTVLSTRATLGFTLASTAISGAFVAFLGTAQQIFADQYGLGDKFPLIFGLLALSIGASTFINGAVVMRLGMRRLAKAASVAAFVSAAVLAAWASLYAGQPPLWLLLLTMMAMFLFIGFMFGNLNALAMEPLGHLAGTAAAVIGSFTTSISAVLGATSGSLYSGTVSPLAWSFTAMTAAAAIAIFVTDKLTCKPAPDSLEVKGQPSVSHQPVD